MEEDIKVIQQIPGLSKFLSSSELRTRPNRVNLFEGSNLFWKYDAKEIVNSMLAGIDLDVKFYERTEDDFPIEKPENKTIFSLRTLARPLLEFFEDTADPLNSYIQIFNQNIFAGGMIIPIGSKIHKNGFIERVNVGVTLRGQKYNIVHAETTMNKADYYGIKTYDRGRYDSDEFRKGCMLLGLDEHENYGSEPASDTGILCKKLRTYKINIDEYVSGVPNYIYTPLQSLDHLEKLLNEKQMNAYSQFDYDCKALLFDLPLIEVGENVREFESVLIEFMKSKPDDPCNVDEFQLPSKITATKMSLIDRLQNDKYSQISTFLCNQQERLLEFIKE